MTGISMENLGPVLFRAAAPVIQAASSSNCAVSMLGPPYTTSRYLTRPAICFLPITAAGHFMASIRKEDILERQHWPLACIIHSRVT